MIQHRNRQSKWIAGFVYENAPGIFDPGGVGVEIYFFSSSARSAMEMELPSITAEKCLGISR